MRQSSSTSFRLSAFAARNARPAACCKLSSSLILAGLLLLSSYSRAASDPAIENLNTLISQNRFAEAYVASQQLLDEYEGAPDFDFLYGLAALETGHPSEAVYAFERLVYTYPDQQRVKLELGRAFYQTNNLTAARRVFSEVLETNPEENVRTNIEAFIDRIDEQEESIAGSFDWYVSSNIGSDTNINSATELGVISTPIGDVTLSANGQSIEDDFLDIGTGMSFVKPLTKSSAFNIRASYNQHNNLDTDAFDIEVMQGEVGYAHLLSDFRLSYTARTQRVDLDGNEFQSSNSIITSLQRNPGNGWSQSLTGAYTAVRYDETITPSASLRDVDQWLISGVLGKSTGNFTHTLSVYYGDEEERIDAGKDNAQTFYGLAFSEQFMLMPGHYPYLRLSMHYSENKAPHVFFGKVRDDDTFSTSMGWIWRAHQNFNVTTDVTYTDNESSLDLYQYDRLKFQTGIRYQF